MLSNCSACTKIFIKQPKSKLFLFVVRANSFLLFVLTYKLDRDFTHLSYRDIN